MKKVREISKVAEKLVASGQVQTPFMFLEQGELDRSLDFFRSYLPEVQLHYAVKANSEPVLLDYFKKAGIRFDVASGNEVRVLRAQGIPTSDLLFSNPVKDRRAVKAIFDERVEAFTYDNAGELEKLAEYRMKHRSTHRPKAILRIKIESKDVQIDLNEKFGASLKEAPELLAKAAELGFEPFGITFHVGTQSFRPENFATGVTSSMLIARIVKERYGIVLTVINIGGGFPDPYYAEAHGVELDRLFQDIRSACVPAIEAGFTLYAEPGRFLVSAAGTLVTEVIGVSTRSGRRWVYLDDGVYGTYSGKSFDHKSYKFFPIGNPSRILDERQPCTVAGPTCDSIDIIEENSFLPSSIARGDYLISINMGAYSIATSSPFNGFQPADVVLVDISESGALRISRSGEDGSELVLAA